MVHQHIRHYAKPCSSGQGVSNEEEAKKVVIQNVLLPSSVTTLVPSSGHDMAEERDISSYANVSSSREIGSKGWRTSLSYSVSGRRRVSCTAVEMIRLASNLGRVRSNFMGLEALKRSSRMMTYWATAHMMFR
mmetsp:Transcript_12070/g.20518  ORF Transcript_12070/g.20518 Transcript_12070/m.20518 type:complete len:133 (-) Transcript_12070:802-1200(-)